MNDGSLLDSKAKKAPISENEIACYDMLALIGCYIVRAIPIRFKPNKNWT